MNSPSGNRHRKVQFAVFASVIVFVTVAAYATVAAPGATDARVLLVVFLVLLGLVEGVLIALLGKLQLLRTVVAMLVANGVSAGVGAAAIPHGYAWLVRAFGGDAWIEGAGPALGTLLMIALPLTLVIEGLVLWAIAARKSESFRWFGAFVVVQVASYGVIAAALLGGMSGPISGVTGVSWKESKRINLPDAWVYYLREDGLFVRTQAATGKTEELARLDADEQKVFHRWTEVRRMIDMPGAFRGDEELLHTIEEDPDALREVSAFAQRFKLAPIEVSSPSVHRMHAAENAWQSRFREPVVDLGSSPRAEGDWFVRLSPKYTSVGWGTLRPNRHGEFWVDTSDGYTLAVNFYLDRWTWRHATLSGETLICQIYSRSAGTSLIVAIDMRSRVGRVLGDGRFPVVEPSQPWDR